MSTSNTVDTGINRDELFFDPSLEPPIPAEELCRLFDASEHLRPITEIAKQPECIAVSRIYDTWLLKDIVLTCIWKKSEVVIDIVEPACTWSARLPKHAVATIFRDWPEAQKTFTRTPSVSNSKQWFEMVVAHAWASADGSGCVSWCNPQLWQDRRQWRLIWAYRWLRAMAWFKSTRAPRAT